MNVKKTSLALLLAAQSLFSATLINSVDTTEAVREIAVSEGRAYIANGNGGLSIYDLLTFDYMNALSTNSYMSDVEVVGDYAYLANNNGGLYIVDISNPASLSIVGSYDTNGYAVDLDIKGDRAYIADNNQGFKIIDISNPANPTLVKAMTINGGGYTGNIEVVGDTLFATTNGNNSQYIVESYDISDETDPVHLDRLVIPTIPINMEIRGNTAYIANFTQGVAFVDLTDITSPHIVSNISIGGYGLKVISKGDYTFTIDTAKTLKIIDNTNIKSPSIVGSFTFTENIKDLDVIGNYLYVISSTKVYVMNLIDKTNPQIYSTYYIQGSYSLSSVTIETLLSYNGQSTDSKEFLFLTDSQNGKVFAYNMPYEYAIGSRKEISLPIGDNGFDPYPQNVDIYQQDENTTALYVAGGLGGIYTIELNTTDIGNSMYKGNYGSTVTNINAYDVTTMHGSFGPTLNVASGSLGVLSYDIKDLDLFTLDETFLIDKIPDTEGSIALEAINNNTFIAVLYDDESVIAISSVFGDAQPLTTEVNSVSENDYAVSVEKERGYATVIDTSVGLFFIDVSSLTEE